MSSYKARMKIPDSWAEKGYCPICSKATLKIFHITGQPDQMACGTCGCAFEIEADGPNIRLDRIGPEYRQSLQATDGLWISVVDVRRQLAQPITPIYEEKELIPVVISETSDSQNVNQSEINKNVSPDQSDLLNQEEVTRRVIGLAELGNKASNISTTLAGAGVSEEMVAIALEEVKSRKIKRKSPLPLALAVIIIVVVGCLGAAAIYLPKLNIMALIGPLTSRLKVLEPSETRTVPTMVYAGTGLPADGSQYFNVIWNLTGSYNDKANQSDSAIPPADLGEIHAQILERLHATGFAELAYKKCQAVYDQQKCYEGQADGNTFCGTKALECSKANLQFLQEQTQLYSLWLGTGCKAFQDYYLKNAVEFPFPDGNCKYP